MILCRHWLLSKIIGQRYISIRMEDNKSYETRGSFQNKNTKFYEKA